MNKLTKQEAIDLLKYPPTHTYQLDGLIPTGVLKQRFDIICDVLKDIKPNYFSNLEDRFLDIGCNKGFFSLYGSQFFDEVVGIDNDKKFIDLCNQLKKKNNTFIHTTFRDFTPTKQFDRIFIGNVHHYLFVESNGWDWIYKLAAITRSGGQVLIEGPIDMACKDVEGLIPENLRDKFNLKTFLEIITNYFELGIIVPTVGYTPDRYIMLFIRKRSLMDNKYELSDLSIIKAIKPSNGVDSEVFLTKNNMVAKVYDISKTDKDEDYFKMKIDIARLSPISNGIVGSIYDKGKFVGWLEKPIKSIPFHYFENELKCFKAHCKNQIFLSRLGYFDGDSATINFVEADKKIITFDKNGVNQIKILNKTYWDLKTGSYPKMLRQSYNLIWVEIIEKICKALSTKDSKEIEKAYQEVLDELEEYNKEASK